MTGLAAGLLLLFVRRWTRRWDRRRDRRDGLHDHARGRDPRNRRDARRRPSPALVTASIACASSSPGGRPVRFASAGSSPPASPAGCAFLAKGFLADRDPRNRPRPLAGAGSETGERLLTLPCIPRHRRDPRPCLPGGSAVHASPLPSTGTTSSGSSTSTGTPAVRTPSIRSPGGSSSPSSCWGSFPGS